LPVGNLLWLLPPDSELATLPAKASSNDIRRRRQAGQPMADVAGVRRAIEQQEGTVMGRIVASVRVSNLLDPEKTVECDALVNTGAAYMVLPTAWQSRLGKLKVIREIDCETATQDLVRAPVCGPVEIRVAGFEPVYGEVLFLEMEPGDGIYEPLLGYIVLEQCQAAVDMLGMRLVHAKKTDLK
jgi:hypothetical protein